MEKDINKSIRKSDAEFRRLDGRKANETSGKNPSLGENNPDEILEEERHDNEDALIEEPIGDNLGEQGETQEQTSGEDATGGVPRRGLRRSFRRYSCIR
jgi:hypothetical protein